MWRKHKKEFIQGEQSDICDILKIILLLYESGLYASAKAAVKQI